MNHEPILIRNATLTDLPHIVAFNERLAWESEHRRLDHETLTRGVQRVLTQPALGRYFVAEAGSEVVGQTMLTYEVTDWRDGLVYWIQSVYVHQDYRRRGVFRRLYEHVLSVARDAGDVRAIRLYVEKDNHGAVQAYQKLGMSLAHFHIYERDL